MKRPVPQSLLVLAALAILTSAGCRPSEPEGGQAAEATAAPAPQQPQARPAPPPSPAPPAGETAVEAAPAAPGGGLPADRPLRAGFLVVDGVYNTELMAPFAVLQHTAFYAKPGIEVFTISPNGQPVTTFEGIRLTPDYSFANAPVPDILVVPSARGSMDADLGNPALIDWIRKSGGEARHVVALCDGAFLLAKAGLLEGRPATTFPDDYGRFSQMFPNVDLRINVSFVDSGKVLTSQGGARSYEVAMHLVDRLYGRQVAAGVGKGLLVPWPPDPDTMTPRVVETTAPSQTPAVPATSAASAASAPSAPSGPGESR